MTVDDQIAGGSHLPTYSPSGHISARAPLVLLVLGLPGTLLLGVLYGIWLHYSPAALISTFGLALAAVFTGLLAWSVCKRGHSRSRRFNGAVGAMLGFAVLWVQWVVWLRMGFDEGPRMAGFFGTSGPVGWITFLGLLAERMPQLDPDRFLVHWVSLLWLAEAALLIWMPASIARMQADEPYSETARTWADKDFVGDLWWSHGTASEVQARLEAEGIEFLLGLARAVDVGAPVASSWWTIAVTGHKVDADPAARWLEIEMVAQSRNNEGKVSAERTPVVSQWIVAAADYERLALFLSRGPAAAADADTTDTVGEDDTDDDVDADPRRPTPPELAAAVQAFQHDDFAGATALAEPHRRHASPSVRADALRLLALCASREEAWPRAFDDYLALFELEPTAMNALQLATTSVMAGELARGQAWFEKAVELNHEHRSIAWPDMHTGFLTALENKGELAAGLPHVEWLRNMFQSMTTTDDNFVFMHGMPFLSVFFERSLPFLRAGMPDSQVPAWYEAMRKHLDNDGCEKLDAWLERLPAATVARSSGSGARCSSAGSHQTGIDPQE